MWGIEAGEVLAKGFGIWERRGPEEEKLDEEEVRSRSEIVNRIGWGAWGDSMG